MMRLLLALVAGVFAGVFEVAVTPFLPVWADIRPLMPLIALLVISTKRTRVAAAVLGGAIVLEAYAFGNSDLPLLRLPLIVVCLDLIASRFLTNRSVYATFALCLSGRFLDLITSWFLTGILFWLGITDGPWVIREIPFWSILWDTGMIFVGFFSVAALSGRFLTYGSSR